MKTIFSNRWYHILFIRRTRSFYCYDFLFVNFTVVFLFTENNYPNTIWILFIY